MFQYQGPASYLGHRNVHSSLTPLASAWSRRDLWLVWGRKDAFFLPIPFFHWHSRHQVWVIPAQAGSHTGGPWIPACAGMTCRQRMRRSCRSPSSTGTHVIRCGSFPRRACPRADGKPHWWTLDTRLRGYDMPTKDASFLPIPFFHWHSRHQVWVIPAPCLPPPPLSRGQARRGAGSHTGGPWIPAGVYPRVIPAYAV
jgi:hypothetical protein